MSDSRSTQPIKEVIVYTQPKKMILFMISVMQCGDCYMATQVIMINDHVILCLTSFVHRYPWQDTVLILYAYEYYKHNPYQQPQKSGGHYITKELNTHTVQLQSLVLANLTIADQFARVLSINLSVV